MIIFGTRIFGSTDSVAFGSERKPAYHVVTKFFHVQFIPFVPLSSYLVLDFLQGKRAISIPLSGKSIGIAWLRCISWWSVVFLGILTLASGDFSWQLLLCFLFAIVAAPFVTWHGYFNDASYGRAMELLGHINLGPRFDATLKRMVDASYISQFSDNGELEALALAIPTATAELVDWDEAAEMSAPECPDDLELQEATAVSAGDSNNTNPFAPTTVVVAQPLHHSMKAENGFSQVSQEQTKGGGDQRSEAQSSIV